DFGQAKARIGQGHAVVRRQATSSPPPSAAPCSAATTGLGQFSMALQTSGRAGGRGGLPNSRISAARDEVGARAGQHHGAHLRVDAGLGVASARPRPHVGAQRIHGRMVDDDDE
ncbi:hypothetical protein AD428_08605, partial [Achromobacter sp. DMS1]